MKLNQLLIIITLIFCSIEGNTQEKYENFKMSYFSGDRNYSIDINQNKNEKVSYFIDLSSADEYNTDVTAMIPEDDIEDMKSAFEKAKSKYIEWKDVAIKNKVTQLDKEVEGAKLDISGAFYYGSEWHFDFSLSLKFRFKIIDDVYVLIVSSGELTSSSNEYIEHKGGYWVFNSIKEIDDFVSKFDITKGRAHFKKDDLFKN